MKHLEPTKKHLRVEDARRRLWRSFRARKQLACYQTFHIWLPSSCASGARIEFLSRLLTNQGDYGLFLLVSLQVAFIQAAKSRNLFNRFIAQVQPYRKIRIAFAPAIFAGLLGNHLFKVANLESLAKRHRCIPDALFA